MSGIAEKNPFFAMHLVVVGGGAELCYTCIVRRNIENTKMEYHNVRAFFKHTYIFFSFFCFQFNSYYLARP